MFHWGHVGSAPPRARAPSPHLLADPILEGASLSVQGPVRAGWAGPRVTGSTSLGKYDGASCLTSQDRGGRGAPWCRLVPLPCFVLATSSCATCGLTGLPAPRARAAAPAGPRMPHSHPLARFWDVGAGGASCVASLHPRLCRRLVREGGRAGGVAPLGPHHSIWPCRGPPAQRGKRVHLRLRKGPRSARPSLIGGRPSRPGEGMACHAPGGAAAHPRCRAAAGAPHGIARILLGRSATASRGCGHFLGTPFLRRSSCGIGSGAGHAA